MLSWNAISSVLAVKEASEAGLINHLPDPVCGAALCRGQEIRHYLLRILILINLEVGIGKLQLLPDVSLVDLSLCALCRGA